MIHLYDNIEYALKQIRSERLAHKNKWLFLDFRVNGRHYRLKSYNTWIQKYYIGDTNMCLSSPTDCSVKVFNETILKGLLFISNLAVMMDYISYIW